MEQDQSIGSLRSRVSALVEREGLLLTQAFELSRAGGDRAGVDALFAEVQAIQVERNRLKKQIGAALGTQRLHMAAEVWRPGVYDYCREAGGGSVRVRITTGPLGLQVQLPGRADAVRIESLPGTFDGPLAADDAAAQQQVADPHARAPGNSPEAMPTRQRTARPRAGKKSSR